MQQFLVSKLHPGCSFCPEHACPSWFELLHFLHDANLLAKEGSQPYPGAPRSPQHSPFTIILLIIIHGSLWVSSHRRDCELLEDRTWSRQVSSIQSGARYQGVRKCLLSY